METKVFRFKASELDESGTFEGLLSTYDKDLGGDRVVPGAFARTLEHWGRKGRPLPMLWNHSPDAPIGAFESVRETEKGLEVRGRLLLSIPKAREVYELMKAGVVHSLSIGYKTIADTVEDGIRQLKEVALYEGSAVLWPMNPEATIASVKAEEDRLARLETQLKEITARLDTPQAPPTNTADSGDHSADPEAERRALEAARQLSDILRRY